MLRSPSETESRQIRVQFFGSRCSAGASYGAARCPPLGLVGGSLRADSEVSVLNFGSVELRRCLCHSKLNLNSAADFQEDGLMKKMVVVRLHQALQTLLRLARIPLW